MSRNLPCRRVFPFFAMIATCVAISNLLAQAPASVVAEPPSATKQSGEPALQWRDITTWGVEGRAFGDMERTRWFDRFPSAAEGKVTKAVWDLSRHSAGMMVRFKTDATTIWADYTLRSERVALANMT